MSRLFLVPASAPALVEETEAQAGHDDGLPEEIVECLERYCDGRCPELAGTLFEALGERAVRAECDLERCTCAALLRHWFGIDRLVRHADEPVESPRATLRSVPRVSLRPVLRLVPTPSERTSPGTGGTGA